MRRNFRRNTGMGRPSTPIIDRTAKVTCICPRYTVDDITGASTWDPWPCQGTATAGVSDCSCCDKGIKYVGPAQLSALTMG